MTSVSRVMVAFVAAVATALVGGSAAYAEPRLMSRCSMGDMVKLALDPSPTDPAVIVGSFNDNQVFRCPFSGVKTPLTGDPVSATETLVSGETKHARRTFVHRVVGVGVLKDVGVLIHEFDQQSLIGRLLVVDSHDRIRALVSPREDIQASDGEKLRITVSAFAVSPMGELFVAGYNKSDWWDPSSRARIWRLKQLPDSNQSIAFEVLGGGDVQFHEFNGQELQPRIDWSDRNVRDMYPLAVQRMGTPTSLLCLRDGGIVWVTEHAGRPGFGSPFVVHAVRTGATYKVASVRRLPVQFTKRYFQYAISLSEGDGEILLTHWHWPGVFSLAVRVPRESDPSSQWRFFDASKVHRKNLQSLAGRAPFRDRAAGAPTAIVFEPSTGGLFFNAQFALWFDAPDDFQTSLNRLSNTAKKIHCDTLSWFGSTELWSGVKDRFFTWLHPTRRATSRDDPVDLQAADPLLTGPPTNFIELTRQIAPNQNGRTNNFLGVLPSELRRELAKYIDYPQMLQAFRVKLTMDQIHSDTGTNFGRVERVLKRLTETRRAQLAS